MFYFLRCDFDRCRVYKRHKTILLTRVLVIQILIVLCKRFGRDINTVTAVSFKHTPKTFGLIFKHFGGLFCKLPTCYLTYLQVSPSSLFATFSPLTMYPACPSHLLFRFPAWFRKPWCQCFPPFVGVPWSLYLYLFNYPCSHSFLQYELLHLSCTFVIAAVFLFH